MWDWVDPRGRCSNREYVQVAAACSAAAAPMVALLATDGVSARTRLGAVVILWLLTGIMWLMAIRRAHDEDYSAWQAYAWMGGPTVLLLVWITLPAMGFFPHMWVLIATFLAGLFLSHVGVYAVAHARDGARPNRFGAPTIQRPDRTDRRRYREMASGRLEGRSKSGRA